MNAFQHARLALPALLIACVWPAGLAWAQQAGVPLPEAGYQLARKQAKSRYDAAMAGCGLVNWSDRRDCELSARVILDKEAAEAREDFLKSQAAVDRLKASKAGQPEGP